MIDVYGINRFTFDDLVKNVSSVQSLKLKLNLPEAYWTRNSNSRLSHLLNGL